MPSAGAPKTEPPDDPPEPPKHPLKPPEDPRKPPKDPPDPPRHPPKPPERPSNHPDDPPEPPDPPKSKPPQFSGPGAAPPPDKLNLENSSSGSQDSGRSGESLPAPAEAFSEPFKDLTNFKDTQHRAGNAFTYTEALGRFMKGGGAKVLAFLFLSKDSTRSETLLARVTIRAIGKGLIKGLEDFAPVNAAIEFIDVFRKNRIGSASFYQNYGMAGLAVIGGMVGVAAIEAWPWLGAWAVSALGFLGISAAVSWVVVPIAAGILGVAVFRLAGSVINRLTQPGSWFYHWYPGSFLDRAVSSSYGGATLGAIGGVLVGAALDVGVALGVLEFGFLGSLGLTGIAVFFLPPLLFGLAGAGVFQLATWIYSRHFGGQVTAAKSAQTGSATRPAPVPQIPVRVPKPQRPDEIKKRPPSVFSLPFEPPRPDGAALGDDAPPPLRGYPREGAVLHFRRVRHPLCRWAACHLRLPSPRARSGPPMRRKNEPWRRPNVGS